jgi:hypothetical protein
MSKGRALFITAVVALLGWMVWPSGAQLNGKCEANGVFAALSEKLFGERFWQAQLPSVRASISQAESGAAMQRRIQSESEDAIQRARASMREVYEKHPSLRPSPAAEQAGRLREDANAIEAAEAFQRMSAFYEEMAADARHCEAKIKAPR